MQIQKVLALAAVAAVAKAVSTESLALRWLQKHRGNPDELSELKDANPDAYALVKALLTKRSLGLLHTRHATASFAAAPQQETQTSGGSHDWMNWEPKDSANNDEAMVKSVLGAVANLAQSKGLPMKAVSHSDNPLETEEATFGFSVVAPTSAPHKVSLASEEEAQQRAALSWHDDSVDVVAVVTPLQHSPDFLPHLAPAWTEGAPVSLPNLDISGTEEATQRAALAWAGSAVPHARYSTPPVQKANGGWMNWKPHSGSEDESMVNSVLGPVAGLTKSSRGAARETAEQPADNPEVSASAAPSFEPMVEAPRVASLPSMSTELHMHHHMSHFWSEEKPAPLPSASIVDQSVPSTMSSYQPKLVASTVNSGVVNDKPRDHSSATDKMVDNLLGMVANVATGRNRDIILRKKARIEGSTVESNPLVDAAETLGVTPMNVEKRTRSPSPEISEEEVKEREALAWHDQGSWAPAISSQPVAPHQRISGSWATSVMPASLEMAPVATAPGARRGVSLWSAIGRTAEMFGVKAKTLQTAEPAPADHSGRSEPDPSLEEPASTVHHSLMAEFLRHSRASLRGQGTHSRAVSTSASLVKDEALFSNSENSESAQEGNDEPVPVRTVSSEEDAEARLADRAGAEKTALSRFVDISKAGPLDSIAAIHPSPLDSFSFEDPTPEPKGTAVADAASEIKMSNNLGSWLGLDSKVTPAQAPTAQVPRLSRNRYMDDLWR